MYGIEDPNFDGSRQQTLISEVISCIQDRNTEEFSTAISNYNQITPFTRVETSLMVKIKELHLPEEATQFVKDENEIDFTGANDTPQEQDNEIDFT